MVSFVLLVVISSLVLADNSVPTIISNQSITWGITNNTKLTYMYRKVLSTEIDSTVCRKLCLYDSTCAAYWFRKAKDSTSNGTCYSTGWPLHKSRVEQEGEMVYCKIPSRISWTKLDVDGLSIKYRYAYKHGITDLLQCLQICELDYSCTLVHFTLTGQCTTSHHTPVLDSLRVGKGPVNVVLVGTVSKVIAVGIGAVILTPASVVASTVAVALMQTVGEVALESIIPNSESEPSGVYIKDVPHVPIGDMEASNEIYLVNKDGRVQLQDIDPLNSTNSSVHIFQESCTNKSSNIPCGVELYENQRWWLVSGWGKTFLADPYQFTDLEGNVVKEMENIEPPKPCKWKSEWKVLISEETDEDGWQYSRDFRWFTWNSDPSLGRYVRRRRWVRTCVAI